MNFMQLEHDLGIAFNDRNLLRQAFTHSSYVNEHRNEAITDNERLEFLGDAVLELGVSQYLYRRKEELPEGDLTKWRASIVCEASLCEFSKNLSFGDYLLLGRGEERSGGRQRAAILADVFEAFLGALYLDQGYNAVIEFLQQYVYPKINTGAFSHAMDYKSKLQERLQQNGEHHIDYVIADEKGPSHDKEFVSQVLIDGSVSGEGSGHTKKEAEQRAAKHTLDTSDIT